MKFMDIINKRQSCRNFLSEQLSSESLEEILKAANAAPVGMGQFDSINLTVIQKPDLLSKIDTNAAEFFGQPDIHPLYNAPALIIVSSIALEDPCLAYANAACIIENMLLAATDMGLGSVYIYGAISALHQKPELIGELNLPDGFKPISAIAVGKPVEVLMQRSHSLDKLKTSFIR